MTTKVAYAIMDETGQYIALDQNSGGYPFPAKSLNQIEFFTSFEAAARYAAIIHSNNRNHNWQVVEVELIYSAIVGWRQWMDDIWVQRNKPQDDPDYQKYLELKKRFEP